MLRGGGNEGVTGRHGLVGCQQGGARLAHRTQATESTRNPGTVATDHPSLAMSRATREIDSRSQNASLPLEGSPRMDDKRCGS